MKKLALLTLVLSYVAVNLHATVLPAEKILPDDTLVIWTIPDFNKAMDLYNKSPQAQLWGDPALKAFKDKFMNKLKSELITPMERDMGIKFDDYTGLAQGQVTIAMTQDGWQGKSDDTKDPGVLFLMDTKDKSSQLKANLADLKRKWVDAGKPLKTEKIRDLEFSVISVSSNDLPKSLRSSGSSADSGAGAGDKKDAKKSDGKQPIYIGQSDSLLVMGTSPRSIEKVLSALSGGSVKTLGENAAFGANYNNMFRDSPMYAWVNVAAFVNMFLQQNQGAPPAAGFLPDFNKLFPALGLSGLKTFALAYGQSSEGARVTMQLSVPEQSRTGLFKILAGEAKDANPPAFVPADVVKFQRWRVDGQKTYESIRKMVRDVSAEGLGSLDMMLGMAESSAKEKNPDFDIKKDLFGNLGDDVITYTKAPKGTTLADLACPPTLYLIGSPAPEKFANALRTLLVFTGQQSAPKEREFLGRKIYSMPLPGMTAGDDSSAAKTLNYASSGGYLALSMDTAILEEYLRSSDGSGKSLRDVPGLNDAAQKVIGTGTSLFSYQNDAEAERALFNLLKKSASSDSGDDLGALAMLFGGMGDDFKMKDWVDFSLLPSFDRISKYFYFTVYSAGATPDGLYLKSFTPVPPDSKK